MPLDLARRLTGRERTHAADRLLGMTLAFVAGATNAGAFLAVRQYTSHMTGILSSLADAVVLRAWAVALSAVGALVSFLVGAAVCALLVNFGHRRQWRSVYATPLLLEALLMLLFGVLGARLAHIAGLFVPLTIMLLCFMMGLQNAVITKISRSVIRTTHVTGMVTDLGIELGRLLYMNAPDAGLLPVRADRTRMRLLASLLLAFFLGGVLGAIGFQRLGYAATIPLAITLGALSVVPAFDDLTASWQEH
ncbi:MAG TPA: YoaK family protein [Gemmatimonas sp.]|uniref:YoaK family protein n=1 Tax=Gemmatimonas sp. TaxID=1962908 RepID=UPI002ED85760